MRGTLIPPDLNVAVTRNYGETAKDKSNELLEHLLIATLSVTLLIAVALGLRESGVVLIAIPVTLALTVTMFFLYGYTSTGSPCLRSSFDRYSGRRCDRRGREHRASFPLAREQRERFRRGGSGCGR